ncbi:Zinc/iron permease, partial [Fistulina hepatica ATCC 64428]
DSCTPSSDPDKYLGLRVGSIFVIWFCSTAGALFPVLARRSTAINVPKAVFDFAKYFGSGVIIATAFIHLLDPAISELSSDCIGAAWGDYPYALALCMLSIFSIFVVELVSFRWGSARLRRLGIGYDAHGHAGGGTAHAAHGPEPRPRHAGDLEIAGSSDDLKDPRNESEAVAQDKNGLSVAAAQVERVVSREAARAVTLLAEKPVEVLPERKLFSVREAQQTFEGLGLGSRLAFLPMPDEKHATSWPMRLFPHLAAVLYGLTTPIGIAVGLAIRTTYAPGAPTASIVSGILDSLSAGVLLYTGLVELLAHEFLFTPEMLESSNGHLAYAICCMLIGCALMALLGKWA